MLALFANACRQDHKPSWVQKAHYRAGTGLVAISDSVQLDEQPAGYTLYSPAAAEPRGLVIFFQDTPLDTLQHPDELKILQPAADRYIAVAFVSTGRPLDFLFSEQDLLRLDSLVYALLQENRLQHAPLLFTGLSLSGTRAARYAAWCAQGRSPNHTRPSALALCDAPLDMIRMYDEHSKAMQRKANSLAESTAALVLPCLLRHLGDPVKDRACYIDYSPYCYAHSLGGNAVFLKDLPVRAYHEPDINWWIINRRKDYYSMNSLDMAGLINQLLLLGNYRAELITLDHSSTNASETPHSWGIIDNEGLVSWFDKLLPAASAH